MFKSQAQYKAGFVGIFMTVLRRGFNDYEDFKDQMEAIDLLLLEEEGLNNRVYSLYQVCCDIGLVRNPTSMTDEAFDWHE